MKEFNDFSEAFDYCRECDKPITVIVNSEKWKLFPSGHAIQSNMKKRCGECAEEFEAKDLENGRCKSCRQELAEIEAEKDAVGYDDYRRQERLLR